MGACVIMPDRANRETISAPVPRITGFQGAIEKAGIADIGIGLCQTDAEHQNNVMRYFVFINRHGPEFLHYMGKVDPQTAYMTVDTKIPYDPEEADKQAENGGLKEARRYPRKRRNSTELNEGAAEEQDADQNHQPHRE